jgi:hypothetical protein
MSKNSLWLAYRPMKNPAAVQIPRGSILSKPVLIEDVSREFYLYMPSYDYPAALSRIGRFELRPSAFFRQCLRYGPVLR